MGPLWRPSCILKVQTDASGRGWGVWIPESQQKAGGMFVGEEKGWPIHRKELHAVKIVVELFGEGMQGRWVEFESDNMVVVTYLRSGGGKDAALVEMVKRIWQGLACFNATVYSAR
jgi:hypothetical protein